MQYTQKELAELCGFSETHISLLECSHTKISDRTLNQLAMMFAIHSLPPDAPVSILQDMLTPQSVLDRRAKAQARLAKRMAKRSKTSKRKPTKRRNPRQNSPSKL